MKMYIPGKSRTHLCEYRNLTMPPKFENLATNQDIVKQELDAYRPARYWLIWYITEFNYHDIMKGILLTSSTHPSISALFSYTPLKLF